MDPMTQRSARQPDDLSHHSIAPGRLGYTHRSWVTLLISYRILVALEKIGSIPQIEYFEPLEHHWSGSTTVQGNGSYLTEPG